MMRDMTRTAPRGLRRIVSLLSLAVLAVTASLFAASPVLASFSQCPSTYFCVWTGYQATGTRCQWTVGYINQTNGFSLIGSSCNNNTKSWFNNDGFGVIMYDANYCNPASASSWRRTVAAGQRASGEGSDWNNRVSSLEMENETTPQNPC
jgi:hypothetical protein